MKEFLMGVFRDKKIRSRFLVLILLLIYIPIFLNIFVLYKSTISTIKEERIDTLNQVLYKANQSIDYNLSNLKEVITEAANDNALNASFNRYEDVDEVYQSQIDMFIDKRLNSLKSESYFIEKLTFVSKANKFSSSDGKYELNEDEFLESELYQEFINSDDEQIWDYSDDKRGFIKEGNNQSLIILQKSYFEIPESQREKKKIKEKDKMVETGILVTVINIDALNSLYKDIPLNDIKDIAIYNEDGNRLFNETKEDNSEAEEDNIKPNEYDLAPKIKELLNKNEINKTQEFDYQGKESLLSLTKLDTVDGWYLATVQSLDSIIGETKSSLMNSFLILGIVGLITSLWIVLELLFFSKVITEKEMSSYRLEVSEDMNNKLRMYKHDFFNHLQIIQGLLEMNKPDRAKSYLSDVVKEGRTITSRYEIGIPEIEATIYSAISTANESGIDVDIDAIELPEDIRVNLYDLSKILTNLLKNAIQALEKSKNDHKLLKIEIYESLGEYVFSIYNNTPIIDENLKDDIFERGFSTNGNKDRGLGLHIAKKLAEKNGGTIDLMIDKGNYFIVRFPVK